MSSEYISYRIILFRPLLFSTIRTYVPRRGTSPSAAPTLDDSTLDGPGPTPDDPTLDVSIGHDSFRNCSPKNALIVLLTILVKELLWILHALSVS